MSNEKMKAAIAEQLLQIGITPILWKKLIGLKAMLAGTWKNMATGTFSLAI